MKRRFAYDTMQIQIIVMLSKTKRKSRCKASHAKHSVIAVIFTNNTTHIYNTIYNIHTHTPELSKESYWLIYYMYQIQRAEISKIVLG